MTAVTAPPARPTPATAPSEPTLTEGAQQPARPTAHRFVAASRALAHRRITGAVLFDTETNGARARLAFPIERVAAARVVWHPVGNAFSASVSGQHMQLPEKTAETLLRDLGKAASEQLCLTGRLTAQLSWPAGADSGADVVESMRDAILDAWFEAADLPMTGAERERLGAAGLVQAAPAMPGFGVHDVRTGDWVTELVTGQRLRAVVAHLPGSSTTALTGVGNPDAVPANAEMPADAGAAAGVLAAINGPVGAAAASLVDEVSEVFARTEVSPLAVIGGHGQNDPVVWLFAGDAGVEVLKARRSLAGVLAASRPAWRATAAQQAVL